MSKASRDGGVIERPPPVVNKDVGASSSFLRLGEGAVAGVCCSPSGSSSSCFARAIEDSEGGGRVCPRAVLNATTGGRIIPEVNGSEENGSSSSSVWSSAGRDGSQLTVDFGPAGRFVVFGGCLATLFKIEVVKIIRA